MLPYLILGVALTAGLLLAGNWFLTADPKDLVKVLKWLLISVIGAVVLFFVLTGRLAWAFAALPALVPFFLRLYSAARMAKNFARMAHSMRGGSGTATGRTSDVETKYLRMSLDHDSGIISGEVISGPYGGRSLDSMALAELLDLLNTCRGHDKPSVRVLEAYLDRAHEDWREHAAKEGQGQGGGTSSAFEDGQMNRDEALRILGLESGASQAEIKEAHRRLISGLHPDHGGSDYLASKINHAKDVLLS